jgi:hypothetical protein
MAATVVGLQTAAVAGSLPGCRLPRENGAETAGCRGHDHGFGRDLAVRLRQVSGLADVQVDSPEEAPRGYGSTSIAIKRSVWPLYRVHVQRAILISCEVESGSRAQAMAALKRAVAAESLPAGYHIDEE